MLPKHERVATILLGIGLLVGLALRIFHLDHQTITHPEFYVPGIPLPDHVNNPSARFTVNEVLAHALFFDKHPPGYYLLMLGWNRTFGIDLFTMRMSSVLFGMLALIAIAFHVRTAKSARAPALAVWLLALHGFHLTWSQQLRPWVLIGTLAIITSMLLVSITRNPRTSVVLAYAVLAAFGLWSDYYFWPIFAAQVCWALLHEADRSALPAAIQAQLLAMILATPLLIYFWLHLTEQPSHIGSSDWSHIVTMLQFGHLLQRQRLAAILSDFAPAFHWATAGLGAICLAAGIRPWPADGDTSDGQPASRGRGRLRIMAATSLLTAGATWLAFRPLVADRKVFLAATAAPFVLLIAAWFLLHTWPRASHAIMRLRPFCALRSALLDPVITIPFVAFTGLMLIGQFAPILAPYALVAFTPFIVVIAARGIDRFGRFRIPVTAIVLALFAFSAYQYATSPISNRDYQALARLLQPRLRTGDTVLLERIWYTAPMHYYLPPIHYRVIPPPAFNDAAAAVLPDTLWIITFGQDDALIDDRISAALARIPGYARIDILTTPTGAAARAARTARR